MDNSTLPETNIDPGKSPKGSESSSNHQSSGSAIIQTITSRHFVSVSGISTVSTPPWHLKTEVWNRKEKPQPPMERLEFLMERNHALFVEVNWSISIYAYAHDLSVFLNAFSEVPPPDVLSSKNISDLRLLKKDVSLEPKG